MTILGCGLLNIVAGNRWGWVARLIEIKSSIQTELKLGLTLFSHSPIWKNLDAIKLPNTFFWVGRVAGIIDIKAKPSPSAELGIGLSLVSHGPIWKSLDAIELPNNFF